MAALFPVSTLRCVLVDLDRHNLDRMVAIASLAGAPSEMRGRGSVPFASYRRLWNGGACPLFIISFPSGTSSANDNLMQVIRFCSALVAELAMSYTVIRP